MFAVTVLPESLHQQVLVPRKLFEQHGVPSLDSASVAELRVHNDSSVRVEVGVAPRADFDRRLV